MALPTVDHVHIRACGQKTILCTGYRPEVLRPTKVQSASTADWRPPKSGDQESDGRPLYPKRSRRPSEMATDGCLVKRRFVDLLDVTGSGVRAR